jgi:hypothetical protein
MSGPGPTERSRWGKPAQRVDNCSEQLVENYRLGSRTRFSVEWKTALATRDRCAGDAAFANSASTGHCQAPRSIEPSGIYLLHSRADLAFRPSSNRSPLPDCCLRSNLGNSFDAPEPTRFYTTDIRHECGGSLRREAEVFHTHFVSHRIRARSYNHTLWQCKTRPQLRTIGLPKSGAEKNRNRWPAPKEMFIRAFGRRTVASTFAKKTMSLEASRYRFKAT